MTAWMRRVAAWLAGRVEPPKPEAAPDPPSVSTTNPYQAGSDRVRQTATWLVGALAAVATVMLAGSQLSSIGELSIDEQPVRLAVAIASALLVVVAVSYAVYRLTEIQMPGEGTVGQIRKAAEQSSALQKLAEGDSGLRAGRPQLSDFLADYEACRQAEWAAEKVVAQREKDVQEATSRETHERAVVALAAARTAHANAGRRVKALRPHMVDLARLASYLEVRERFKRERVRIMLAAVAAAVLLVCFAWAANPPAAAGNSAEAVAPKPSAGRLVLTPAGVTELGAVVGDACARRARSSGVAAVALAFDADVYDVLVLPGADCPRPVRVSMPTRLGNVVGDATVVLAPSPT